jgi:hypothetical protein
MIIVKIDAVNMVLYLKSVNVVSSIFLFTFLRPVGIHSVTGMSTKMILSFLSSFMQSGTAEAVLYGSVFVGCCCCMYFVKIKL